MSISVTMGILVLVAFVTTANMLQVTISIRGFKFQVSSFDNNDRKILNEEKKLCVRMYA